MLHNFKTIRDRVEALPLDSVECEKNEVSASEVGVNNGRRKTAFMYHIRPTPSKVF